MKRVVEWMTRGILSLVKVESGAWYWIRDSLTFMPGALGTVMREVFYRRYFKRCGADLLVVAGAHIEHPQNLECGDHVSFGRNSWVDAIGGLTIGSHTGIAPGVVIHTANHNYEDAGRPFKQQGHSMKPVTIGEDVWLAANVIVLPGTNIGNGAVIAAGSVVSGAVEPYSLMAGFPARRMGIRGRDVMSARTVPPNGGG